MREAVHEARHRDHPAAGRQLGQQQAGQEERTEVVGGELALEAVDRAAVRRRHDAGVVDEQVERAVRRGLGRRGPHRRQVREIDHELLECCVRHLCAQRRLGLRELLGVATGQDDPRAGPGELERGVVAQAAHADPGHQRGPAALRRDVGG